jgi:predicted small lipoprotein YifL
MSKIKKLLAAIMAVLMLVSLVACGEGNGPANSTTAPKATDKATESPAATDPAPDETTAPAANLTVHENTFFTVGYNEEDGWTLAEDDIEAYEGGGYAYLRILDEDGYTGLLVYIEAYEESASSFRETLYANGVDMKAYVDGIWVSETIGGLQMAAVDKEDGEWYFFGRNEAAGVSYTVHVTDWENPNVPAVIENISFTASGTDNIDPPWPWEGDPFSGSTLSQMVGTYNLTAQFLPMEEPLVTYETFDHDIVVMGDKVYLLSDCALYQYAYDGDSLAFVKEIELPGEYEILEKGANGNLVLSRFMEPVFGHNGDSAQFSYDGPDKFAVAPGGTWGISWFYSGDECQLYSFHDSVLTGSPFPFPEVDSIRQVSIDNQYILVSGSAKADNEQYIFVYDYSGELQMQLGGEPDGFGLGSITYATSTPNGFLALDGNMREVVLWTADGTWIGAVDDGDLFGTGYPWIAAADIADDGSILVVMSDTRADESADEVLVFKLSGF